MVPDPDPDAELDALVAMLEEAALAEPYVNDDGKPAIRLTARGAAIGSRDRDER